MADVIELTHPTPRDERQSALFRWLLDHRHHGDGRADPAVLPLIAASIGLEAIAVEDRRALLRTRGSQALAQAGTSWERLSGWLPGGMDADAWEAVIPTMGVMALVRNLRNLDQAGISEAAIDAVIAKISDPAEVTKARLFPYQVWSAYAAAPSESWKRALGRTLDATVANIPSLDGTLVVIDTSASMQAPVSGRSTVIGPESRYRFVNQATLLSVERAASLQLTGAADPLVAFVSPEPLTADQREALRDLEQVRNEGTLRLASAPGRSRTVPPEILQVLYVSPPAVSPLLVYAILDGLALLFTGFVIAVGLALAAAETREEVEVLTAVGASPSTLRRLAGAKAALLALSGVALAVPTGLIPVWVVRNASAGTSRFIVPWPSLGLLLVALPAAMAVLALGGSAVHARLRPITASTMTTD